MPQNNGQPSLIQLSLTFPQPNTMQVRLDFQNVPGGWQMVQQALLQAYALAVRKGIESEQQHDAPRLVLPHMPLPPDWEKRN